MEQLRIETTEKITSCAFTGHRRLGEDFDPERLKKEIESCVSRGVSLFYCGMTAGFDLYAAECVVELKRKLPFLRLAACIPCDGQEKYFSFEDKKRYVKILAACDEKILLAERYFRGCMQRRNAYMAERADALIAYCRKERGGAAHTLNCFLKKGKPVFNV